MTRSSCIFGASLAGMLTFAACAPARAPAPSQRLLLAQATPAPDPPPSMTPAEAAPAPPLDAQPPAETPPSPRSTQPSSTDPRETPGERESRQLGRAWGWVSVGLGGAAGLIAVGTSILMLEDSRTRNAGCNAQKMCSSSGSTANTALSDLAGWNTVSWVVTAAGLGVGAYLLITHPTDKAMGAQVGVVPNGSGADLQLRGSF